MSGFQRFVIADVDETYAPTERDVLDVCVISGTAFLRIGKQKSDAGEIIQAAQVAVHLDDLYDCLATAQRADMRASMRPKTAKGPESA